MPTYEYVCDACEHRFELFQSMKDDPVRSCPECKKRKVRRLISAGAGVLFKGSGFYQTDYRSASYKEGQAADKKAAESGACHTEKAGDKKADSGCGSCDTAPAKKGAKAHGH